MRLDEDACTGCGICLPYCPVGALSLRESCAVVDQDLCVECHACVRAGACSAEALQISLPPWPRALRARFSDPLGKHPSTQHLGRGTEEVKTNDVTGLVGSGQAGIVVEVGRPGVGARLDQLEVVTRTYARHGVRFPQRTPVTALLADFATGALLEEIKQERVLSVIAEGLIDLDKLPALLADLAVELPTVETVFSVGVILRAGPAGELPLLEGGKLGGFPVSAAGKTNLGLGRPLGQEGTA